MTDRPILFSAPMVRALLVGTQTQTRRVLRMPDGPLDAIFQHDGVWWTGDALTGEKDGDIPIRIKVGDRLWVRESWDFIPLDEPRPEGSGRAEIVYWADADRRELSVPAGFNPIIYGCERFRPSIHMPRWASRLTLTVTDVRVQPLQDISEEDARAEGAELNGSLRELVKPTYRAGFARIWAGIHEPSLTSETCWGRNPWVVAYSFTVERRNIDAEG